MPKRIRVLYYEGSEEWLLATKQHERIPLDGMRMHKSSIMVLSDKTYPDDWDRGEQGVNLDDAKGDT